LGIDAACYSLESAATQALLLRLLQPFLDQTGGIPQRWLLPKSGIDEQDSCRNHLLRSAPAAVLLSRSVPLRVRVLAEWAAHAPVLLRSQPLPLGGSRQEMASVAEAATLVCGTTTCSTSSSARRAAAHLQAQAR